MRFKTFVRCSDLKNVKGIERFLFLTNKTIAHLFLGVDIFTFLSFHVPPRPPVYRGNLGTSVLTESEGAGVRGFGIERDSV